MSKKYKPQERVPKEESFKLRNFTFLSKEQKDFAELVKTKKMTICTGKPGSGKTFVSLGVAFSMLGPIYKRIVIAKSVKTIEGEAIGFIPGLIEEKMAPTLISFTANIDKLFQKKGIAQDFIKKGIVEIQPLAYIRGITIDDAIVILDEAQNLDMNTFKSIVTRMGYNCKYILLGDTGQIDLKDKSKSCLNKVVDMFAESETVGTINFEKIHRDSLVEEMLETLEKHGY